MLFCALFFVYFTVVYGFLLDTNIPQTSGAQFGSNNQYLTVSEFYEEKKQQRYATEVLRHETEQLRHDVDNTFTLMTSQLQKQLADLKQEISTGNCKENETFQYIDTLEQKYKDLEDNNTKLQEKFDALMIKYAVVEHELLSAKNRALELERSVEKSFNTTTQRIIIRENKLILVENKTLQFDGDIADLKKLKNIQPLHDIYALQQQVQSIISQTHALSVNERARTQDFLALYNKTIASDRIITDLALKTDNRLQSLQRYQNATLEAFDRRIRSNLQTIEISQNATLEGFDKKIDQNQNATTTAVDQKVQSLTLSFNSTLSVLEKEIAESKEKVAVTACVSKEEDKSAETILKFDDVRTNIGISKLSAFQTSGMFTCDRPGLYHISVYISTHTGGVQFSIYKNGNSISTFYVCEHTGSWAHTGTDVVAVELQAGDNVWVRVDNGMYVHARHWSCITIVKIK